MKKISVIIAKRHNTSFTLEDEFYQELIQIAKRENVSLNQLITDIDAKRTAHNLSSAVRVFILNDVKKQI